LVVEPAQIEAVVLARFGEDRQAILRRLLQRGEEVLAGLDFDRRRRRRRRRHERVEQAIELGAFVGR
jgi:hypothetical protein